MIQLLGQMSKEDHEFMARSFVKEFLMWPGSFQKTSKKTNEQTTQISQSEVTNAAQTTQNQSPKTKTLGVERTTFDDQ